MEIILLIIAVKYEVLGDGLSQALQQEQPSLESGINGWLLTARLAHPYTHPAE